MGNQSQVDSRRGGKESAGEGCFAGRARSSVSRAQRGRRGSVAPVPRQCKDHRMSLQGKRGVVVGTANRAGERSGTAMYKNRRFGALVITLALCAGGYVARADAQSPRDAESTPGMMGPGMMGPGMMGPGEMGPGMMAPSGTPGPSSSPTGAPASGRRIFRSQCAFCHTLQAGGGNRAGPNLHGLFGRRAGSAPGYAYSVAMRNADVVWDDRTLDAFLAAPHDFIPGDKMPFAGIADKAERDALIAYLKTASR